MDGDLADTDLCIVGGGPAGMMAGLLFARAGVRTTVLEKHADFLRDFRGDTVHPSTLRLLSDLGLLERFLDRPHDKVRTLTVHMGGRRFVAADFAHFDPRWNFAAMMPQWHFLDFLADEAKTYSNFRLVMQARAVDVISNGDQVTGVRWNAEGGEHRLSSGLVIAADGRSSEIRSAAQLPLRSLEAPMDVFWFQVPKTPTPDNCTTGYFGSGHIVALIDRNDYWQCAYVFAKGGAEAVRARGLDAFRAQVARAAPVLADGIATIASWNDVKLLTVEMNRLERWHRPGLLVIGDAAHAMSPVGGVGINVAIQDAVAAANILAGPLAAGRNVDHLLKTVRKRRRLAVAVTQAFQVTVQKRLIRPLLAGAKPVIPLPFRLLERFAILRTLPAAFIGFGIKAERVRSPAAAWH